MAAQPSRPMAWPPRQAVGFGASTLGHVFGPGTCPAPPEPSLAAAFYPSPTRESSNGACTRPFQPSAHPSVAFPLDSPAKTKV
ncbi:unnamed protein product [Urochloa humidicola]